MLHFTLLAPGCNTPGISLKLIAYSYPYLSAKDKVILESAYNANPKPDKAARLDIVKRVSLNEKEVQVRIHLNNACTLRRAYTRLSTTSVKQASWLLTLAGYLVL